MCDSAHDLRTVFSAPVGESTKRTKNMRINTRTKTRLRQLADRWGTSRATILEQELRRFYPAGVPASCPAGTGGIPQAVETFNTKLSETARVALRQLSAAWNLTEGEVLDAILCVAANRDLAHVVGS